MDYRYILLTAAKNEEAFIGEAIHSVLRQTVLPLCWFIVDDGSGDTTPQIVESYAKRHQFIRLLFANTGCKRDFASKDRAINRAYEYAKQLDFDFVGVQDADIAPERTDYYEAILGEFERDLSLGIAGGFIYERVTGEWQCRRGNSEDSVAGGIQMFRRSCFDQIGGYTPLPYGGEDTLIQLEAQMLRWQIRTFPDHRIFHYRPTSTAGGKWRGLFRAGLEDASFGYHPLFELLKCCRRVTSRPYVLSSAMWLCGYLWWSLAGRKPVIQAEKVAFLRKEQMARIRRQLWPLRARSSPSVTTPQQWVGHDPG